MRAVTGTDGHHAPPSWAETDPDVAHAPVLPRERCGARYGSGVRAIRVDGGHPHREA
ncbi:hypothetical protein ACIRPX_24005 [Streptomyces sp. NPDC101225]|uniref:hypothetical protein n=1 Tax=Streptomyces sp. NPDC101225 TaxID=3366135 RepID=UPI00381405EC